MKGKKLVILLLFVLLFCAVGSALGVDDSRNRLPDPAVYEELQASADGTAYVIVLLKPEVADASRKERQAAVRDVQDRTLAELAPGEFTIAYKYKNFAAMTGRVNEAGLSKLIASKDVIAVGPDARIQGHLDDSVPFINADDAHTLGYTGDGITVAVLDTGIDNNHPDLSTDIAPGWYHFLGGGSNVGPGAYDRNGHGTNVSGIITSGGVVAPLGVAPDANILAIQVLDSGGGGYVSDWAAGVDYVVSHKDDYDNLCIINMSLGTDFLYSVCPCDDYSDYTLLMQTAIQAAKDIGIVTFASSGNDGSCGSMSSPACVSAATAVAAVYDQDLGREPDSGNYSCGCSDASTYGDLITCFSNRSGCNELAAPGRHITAPGLGGGTSTYTGTSQAAPHCSAVAALMCERAADCGVSIKPDQIVQIMKDTGVSTTDLCYTSPNPIRVDALAAIEAIKGKPSTPHTKWSQPPVEVDPGSDVPEYCGWDEQSSLFFTSGVSVQVYQNFDSNGVNGFTSPGTNLIADDIYLAGTGRELDHYNITVYASTGAPYTVTSELYTDSSGLPGTPIAGTYCVQTVPSNGTVVLDCAPGSGVILPDKIWIVLSFSNVNAGWSIGEAAELGSTDNVYAVYSGGSWSLKWFGGDPYASFEANIWCITEDSFNGDIVADDFRCIGPMPVTSIHWWGSHVGWEGLQPPPAEHYAWRIGFWSNVPAGVDANYSHPQELLWQIEVPVDRVDVNYVGDDYFPEVPFSDTCFQYYLDLNEVEYFWQDEFAPNTIDNVFWLSIAAVYPDVIVPDYPWGWKTRPWHWMDDAVVFGVVGSEPGVVVDPCDVTPIKDPVWQESFDVSFELDTDPNYIKWEQLYTGICNWLHYEDEKSMDITSGWFLENAFSVPGITTRLDGLAYNDSTGHLFGCDPTPADDILYEFTTSGTLIDSYVLDFLPDVGGSRSLAYNSNTGNLFLGENAAHRIYEITTDGNYVGYFNSPGTNPEGLTYNSAADTLFVASTHWTTNIIYEVDPNGGSVLNSFSAPGEDVKGLAFDGNNLLTYDIDDQRIYLLDPANGTIREWFDITIPSGPNPWTGLACDGTRIYAWNQSNGKIHVYAPSTPRLVADDWRCLRRTPVTAIAWWGSYIGYSYEACYGPFMPLPVKPDYFKLNMWTDVAAGEDPCVSYSHPNDIIWEYVAYDYDEVLVGYDKHPYGEPNEPVFRYSVRLPEEEWFHQPDYNGVFWLSVQAIYDFNVPNYDWGWTNHKHVFNDNAVSGYYDDVNEVWVWTELYDQMDKSEDMSFILFTDPNECINCADYDSDNIVDTGDLGVFVDDWLWIGSPGGYCNGDLNCDGKVTFVDYAIFAQQWLGSCP